MSRAKSYEKGSMMHFADRGLTKISTYARSPLQIDRLKGFNTIGIILLLSVIIYSELAKGITGVGLLLIIFLSVVFAAGAGFAYSFVLDSIVNLARFNLKGMRASIAAILIAIPISVYGAIYGVARATNFAIAIIFIQLLIVLVTGFIIHNSTTELPVTQSPGWELLGKVNTLLGIVSSVVTIILFIVKP